MRALPMGYSDAFSDPCHTSSSFVVPDQRFVVCSVPHRPTRVQMGVWQSLEVPWASNTGGRGDRWVECLRGDSGHLYRLVGKVPSSALGTQMGGGRGGWGGGEGGLNVLGVTVDTYTGWWLKSLEVREREGLGRAL